MDDIDKFFKQPWAIPTVVIGGGLALVGGLGTYLNRKKDTGLRDYSKKPVKDESTIWDFVKPHSDDGITNENRKGEGEGVKKSRRKRKSLVRGSKKKR